MPKADIAPVLEYYGMTVPPPRGGWQTVRCPFHQDRMASARINLETQGFRCFACDIKGDAIDVVSWKEGKDFAGAIDFITGVIGAEIQDVRQSAKRERERSGILDESRIDQGQRTIFQAGGRYRALDGG